LRAALDESKPAFRPRKSVGLRRSSPMPAMYAAMQRRIRTPDVATVLVFAPVCTADVVKEVSCVTVEVDVLTVVDVRVVRTVVADEGPLEA